MVKNISKIGLNSIKAINFFLSLMRDLQRSYRNMGSSQNKRYKRSKLITNLIALELSNCNTYYVTDLWQDEHIPHKLKQIYHELWDMSSGLKVDKPVNKSYSVKHQAMI